MSSKGKGYAAYEDDEVLAAVRPREKLYLLRAPLDLDLSQLDGKKINLGAMAVGGAAVPLGAGLRLQLDDFGQQTLRAIVQSSVTNQPCIGPSFAGSLSVTRDLVSALVPDRSADALPVNAYKAVPQVADLKMRSMPKGSTTLIEDVWAATARSKRPAEGAAAAAAGEGGEKSAKKAKKKDKKESRARDD